MARRRASPGCDEFRQASPCLVCFVDVESDDTRVSDFRGGFRVDVGRLSMGLWAPMHCDVVRFLCGQPKGPFP
jgi:hypothetical protein